MMTPPASTTTGSATAPAPVPLHLRTRSQLQDGLEVSAGKVAPRDLAVVRLVQDAADAVARIAGTHRDLSDLDLHDRSIDEAGARGQSAFIRGSAWMGLSERATNDLAGGIARLRRTPLESWTERQRSSFIAGIETVLHESSHVTLPKYGPDDVAAFQRASRPIEEGISQLNAQHQLVSFVRDEFGIDLPLQSVALSRATTSFGRAGAYLERLVDLATGSDPAATSAMIAKLSDGIATDGREQWLAQAIADRVAAGAATAKQVAELAAAIPPLVEEQPGSRTRMMDLIAKIADSARR